MCSIPSIGGSFMKLCLHFTIKSITLSPSFSLPPSLPPSLLGVYASADLMEGLSGMRLDWKWFWLLVDSIISFFLFYLHQNRCRHTDNKRKQVIHRHNNICLALFSSLATQLLQVQIHVLLLEIALMCSVKTNDEGHVAKWIIELKRDFDTNKKDCARCNYPW